MNVQRLSRKGVHPSGWKRSASYRDEDIVSSAWKHAAVHKRTGMALRTISKVMWSNFQQFFKQLMQDKVIRFNRPTIFTAHLKDELDEKTMSMKTHVPVKGALKSNGLEAYYSTVVSAKKVDLKTLEKYGSDLLTITEEEKELGYKHVFQTRITKETVGERIRSPMGMFTREQTFIDNDVQLLLDHLHDFYN